MRSKGILTLIPTILLCLPALVGGWSVLLNLSLQRPLEQWGQGSSAFVALAVLLGGPLAAAAAIVGVLVSLSQRIPARVKWAHLVIVAASAVSVASLQLHFAR